MRRNMTGGLALCLVFLLGMFVSGADGAETWKAVRKMTGLLDGSRLEQPLEMTVDPVSHRYFVADAANGILMSFDEQGNRLAAFNAGGQIRKPVDLILVDPNRLWVADRTLNQLLYIDVGEKKVRTFSLQRPDGKPIVVDRIGLDGKGGLLVLDRLSGNILGLDDNLAVIREFSGGKTSQGFCDFKIKRGELWALDGLAHTVYRFSSTGELLNAIPLSGELQFPVGLEIDEFGQLYILDRHAGDVRIFDQQGRFKSVFSGKGKREGQLWYPSALAFDWAQRLCVVDEGNARIQIYSRK